MMVTSHASDAEGDMDFSEWLRSSEGGCCASDKAIGSGLYAAIKPLLFHWTLIVGEIGDRTGYLDRWCYQDRNAAESALDTWNGNGEPHGWHRHPRTSRRRENADPAKETVSW